MTPILKKLEALGYLTRQRDPSDERQVIVSLTDAGRELRTQAFETDLVAATGLSLDELKTMQRGVSTLLGQPARLSGGRRLCVHGGIVRGIPALSAG